ncbi:hypothetical protein J7E88_06425 [Streptomyces sp. ISL-10]|uniref:hypothetical protein n=1 Tax=Streptomyces sp. ISL-10 TaxID=2819172 RepID=UPI001BEABF08|nr:hypothetical protein [Streptomyces sp. ISL-10]MBT2364967.1 hypothetical protein [Streptomyces sp. ISL-10]
MFTGYAAIAYTYGITSCVTWSFPIAIGIAKPFGGPVARPGCRRRQPSSGVARG